MSQARDLVVNQLQTLGWSRDQAIGIAANLHQESSFRADAVGDGGKAYGIAQWHPDRQANFQAWAGKPIQGSSLEDQVAFVDYELRKGAEQAAGKRLLAAKDAGDAASIVSQFYERPKDRAGEANRRGRMAAGWAGGSWEDIPAVAPPQGSPQAAVGASVPWFRLPTPARIATAAPAGSQAPANPLLGALESQLDAADPAAGRAQTEAAQEAVAAEAAKRTGFGDVFQAGRRDPRTQAMFTLLDRINGEGHETPSAEWGTYADNQDRIEAGMSDDERAYLRENVTGPQSEQRALGQIAYRRELDQQVYGRATGWANFAGQMAAGALDPVGWAAGFGTTKAFQMSRIGSGALIAAGRGGAASVSVVAEAAVGNMAVEFLQDVAGEVKGTSDYAMAAGLGAVLTAPFLRGVHKQAAAKYSEAESIRLQQEAAEHQARTISETQAETGIDDPTALAREHERREAEEIDRATGAATSSEPRPDSALPQDVQDSIRAEANGEPPPAVVKEQELETKAAERDAAQNERETAEAIKAKEEKQKAADDAAKAAGQEPATPPTPTLPPDLAKATPGYSYGKNRFKLQFDNDLDRVAYIVSGKGESKAHGRYVMWLKDQGVTLAEAKAFGKQIREAIKQNVAGRPSGDVRITDGKLLERLDLVRQRIADKKQRAADRAAERQNAKEAPPPPAEFDFPKLDEGLLDAAPGGGAALTENGGHPARLFWDLRKDREPIGMTHKVADVLEGLIDMDGVPNHVRALANYLHQKLSAEVSDVNIHFKTSVEGGKAQGVFDPNSQHIEVMSPKGALGTLDDQLDTLSDTSLEAIVHEVVHAATHSKIEAYKNGELKAGEAYEAVKALEDLMRRYKWALLKERPEFKGMTADKIGNAIRSGIDRPDGVPWTQDDFYLSYAFHNLHEFATMTMSNPAVQARMRQMEGIPVAGRPTSLWQNFIRAITKVLGLDGDGTFLGSATATVDRVISAPGSFIKYYTGEPALQSPALFNGAAQRRNAQSILQHAQTWLAQNPINGAKLGVLTNYVKKWGGLSDGLVLAQSKNPILQMVAGLVTEVTTGAAGRRATVAVRRELVHRRLIGNAMIDFDAHYSNWNKRNGGTLWDDAVVGEQRRRFNREVYKEVLDRRNPTYQGNRDTSVTAAADALEKMFERARQEQINSGTLGSANLPDSSRGYLPQALDGAKLQNLSVQELAALHNELSSQFQTRLGWDKAFADTFAPYYTDRVRKRSQGSKEVDALSGGGDGMQLVRDTLDEMTGDPTLRDRATAALTQTGSLKQTKARLDLDLQRSFAPGKTLLDVFVDDPLTLGRLYANRTAGEVALTEQGILGIRGVRELREAAAANTGAPQASLQELEAFDRVMSELMGTPVAGQVVSAGATNLRLLVGLQRLGGLVFTQAMEAWNAVHHVGLRSTLASIGALPRMIGEVGRLKKGAPSGNHILTSMEFYGGEFGMEHYKMVAPLDPPDAQVEQYMKQSGLIGRLLRGGAHLQSKVSFFRGLLASQHRAVAEQVIMRGLRFVRDGGNEAFLADMGFTPELVRDLKPELPRIATWDSNGHLTRLDLTQVSDPRIAEALTIAVHRGVSQIIQGTFVGERSAWMHNDYLKLLLQLRTFGLTATEKQLGRVAGVQGGGAKGYSYAAGLMLGQMALALPMHLARVNLTASGREDKDQFIADNTNPAALIRATMNYSSLSGSTGDVLELMTGLAGGWLDAEGRETVGARTGPAAGVSKLVPALGSAEGILKAVSGQSDIHRSIKQLPFSNLWYLQPAINVTDQE